MKARELAAYRADGRRWAVTAWTFDDGDEIEVIVAEGWARRPADALGEAVDAIARLTREGVLR